MTRTFYLALRDLRHDALHFACAVILIAAMIGPFLVLLGVKIGTISVLLGELRDNPQNRQVEIVGAHTFSPEDVAAVRALATVAFAEGQNSVTATGRLALRTASGDRMLTGGYGVTGAGDPLTASGGDLRDNEIILSDSFARQLKAEAGTEIRMEFERGDPFAGYIQPLFTVREVLPRAAVDGKFVLLTSKAIADIEAFGLGFAIPAFGVDEGEDLSTRVDSFEKIRVYAQDLEDIPPLVTEIETRFRVQTRSKEAQVIAILRLERNLGAALGFVTSAGLIGLLAVLTAHFWSAVRRKQLQWSLLTLLGTRPVSLAVVPVVQAVLVSLAGFFAGCGIYLFVSRAIDGWFAPMLNSSASLSMLPVTTGIQVGLVVVVTAALASAVAALSVLRTDPAKIIRST